MNILFVCSGNISRSFLAEVLLEHEINQLDLDDISVSSAGLFALPGNPADPGMVEYLLKLGIPVKSHRARQITVQDVRWADLILVMEKAHGSMIKQTWPEAKTKVGLLGKFISNSQNQDNVVDPFGRTPYHYRLAQSQITLAVNGLVKKLVSKKN